MSHLKIECPACGLRLSGSQEVGYRCARCHAHYSARSIARAGKMHVKHLIGKHFSGLPRATYESTKIVVEDTAGRIQRTLDEVARKADAAPARKNAIDEELAWLMRLRRSAKQEQTASNDASVQKTQHAAEEYIELPIVVEERIAVPMLRQKISHAASYTRATKRKATPKRTVKPKQRMRVKSKIAKVGKKVVNKEAKRIKPASRTKSRRR